MKRRLMTAMMVAMSMGMMNAQTVKMKFPEWQGVRKNF